MKLKFITSDGKCIFNQAVRGYVPHPGPKQKITFHDMSVGNGNDRRLAEVDCVVTGQPSYDMWADNGIPPADPDEFIISIPVKILKVRYND